MLSPFLYGVQEAKLELLINEYIIQLKSPETANIIHLIDYFKELKTA